jgi:DNA-binding response OmpR family regulator
MQRKVLVVDDEQMMLRAVTRELKMAGWEVTTSVSPVSASGYDAALLDLEPHGVAMIQNCGAASVPFVIFTGNVEKAVELRAAGKVVIDKPWQLGELDAALGKVVGP